MPSPSSGHNVNSAGAKTLVNLHTKLQGVTSQRPLRNNSKYQFIGCTFYLERGIYEKTMFKVTYCHAIKAFLELVYLYVVIMLCENRGSIFTVGMRAHRL
jgi:hypothetical protein